MPLTLLAMALRVAKTTTSSETLGEPTGVSQDTSESLLLKEMAFAEFKRIHLIQLPRFHLKND